MSTVQSSELKLTVQATLLSEKNGSYWYSVSVYWLIFNTKICTWQQYCIQRVVQCIPAKNHCLLPSLLLFWSVHEKKCISRGEAVAPATQSKLSRVSSGFGLSKLTGVRRNKKENSLNKNNLSAQVHTLKTHTQHDFSQFAPVVCLTCADSVP